MLDNLHTIKNIKEQKNLSLIYIFYSVAKGTGSGAGPIIAKELNIFNRTVISVVLCPEKPLRSKKMLIKEQKILEKAYDSSTSVLEIDNNIIFQYYATKTDSEGKLIVKPDGSVRKFSVGYKKGLELANVDIGRCFLIINNMTLQSLGTLNKESYSTLLKDHNWFQLSYSQPKKGENRLENAVKEALLAPMSRKGFYEIDIKNNEYSIAVLVQHNKCEITPDDLHNLSQNIENWVAEAKPNAMLWDMYWSVESSEAIPEGTLSCHIIMAANL